jgi:hypothetical protein
MRNTEHKAKVLDALIGSARHKTQRQAIIRLQRKTEIITIKIIIISERVYVIKGNIKKTASPRGTGLNNDVRERQIK